MPESKRPAKKKITAKKAAVKIPVEAKEEPKPLTKEEPKPVAKKAPAPKPTPKPKASSAAELLKAFSKEAAGKDGKTKAKLKVKLKEDLAALKKK